MAQREFSHRCLWKESNSSSNAEKKCIFVENSDMRRCPGEAGKELKLLITSEDECRKQSEGCQGITTFVINII